MKCRCLSCILWSIYDRKGLNGYGFNELHRMVMCNRVKISSLRKLLKTENPNAKAGRYETPLHVAARFQKNPEVFVELINAGAKVQGCNKFEDTPLHVAVKMCNIVAIEVLLQSGANVNSKTEFGKTPLHLANWSSLKYKPTVEKLLQAGADVNSTNYRNRTPLFLAVQAGNLDGVKELLKFGANPNTRDDCDNTLLHLAAKKENNLEILVELINVGVELDSHNFYEVTPLHVAVSNCNIKTTEVLLQSGAYVNSRNRDGNTPLHLINWPSLKYKRIVEKLIQAGADVNITNNNNETPLFRVVQSGNVDVVKELLKFGADPNICKYDSNSCLHIALLDIPSNKEILEELVKSGANINRKDRFLKTPLDLAVLKYLGDPLEGFKDAMALIRIAVLVDLHVLIDLNRANRELEFKNLYEFYEVCFSSVRTMTLIRITEFLFLHDFALRGMNCTVFSSNIIADHICSEVLLNLLKINFYPYNDILESNLPNLYLSKVIMNMGIVSNNGDNQRDIELSSDVVSLLCEYLNVTDMLSFIKAFSN